MFTNNEEMIVLLGGDTIDERTNLEIDNPELNGLAAYLAENIGYENIAVVPGGYDGWVGEYTPGGKKRLKEWSLDYVPVQLEQHALVPSFPSLVLSQTSVAQLNLKNSRS